MNIGKIRRFLHRAERVLGVVEGRRYGHYHYHRRRRRARDELLRQIFRRLR